MQLLAVLLVAASALTATDRRPALKQLHEVLRHQPRAHDAYLAAIEIGDETTIPPLLERLRLDYGESEPAPGDYGYVCTHVHLVDALRAITNTDQGMFYPRWKAWWAKNQHLTRQQWIFNGFAERGLHPAMPVDDRFGLELTKLLDKKGSERFLVINVTRMLQTASARSRHRWSAETTFGR